jgi:Protein of unknown function (DUF3102)
MHANRGDGMNTPLVVVGDTANLPELAGKINETVKAAESSAASAMQHAMQAGELLRQAKALVAHGDWLKWLTVNCTKVAPRTAQVYMRLSSKVPELPEANTQHVAYLPVREAIRAITTTAKAPSRLSGYRARRGSSRGALVRAADLLSAGNTAARMVALLATDQTEVLPSQANSIREKLNEAIEAVSPGQVEKMRKKLNEALEALDALVMRGAA